MNDHEDPSRPPATREDAEPRPGSDRAPQTLPIEDRPTRREPGGDGVRLATPLGDAPRYRPGTLLGRGGMGEVRLHFDARIGREVAVKTLHDQAASGSKQWLRFVREARVQGQLEHPAIVPVYDLDSDEDGALFFSMRRVRGVSLSSVLERLAEGDPEAVERWSRRRLLSAFVQVCRAVDYAHTQGVVHRDLKPANIMLGDFGEVQVLDWGIARVLRDHPEETDSPGDPSPSPDLTAEGTSLGTPHYMPPEQVSGELALIDARSDVYALGLMLYELLARRAFHAGRNAAQIYSRALAGIEPRPSEVMDDVDPALDALCLAATRRLPEERLPSARALADALERYLDGESDRARRLVLAREHARHAEHALDRPGAATDPEARRGVLREALQAMALDPEQRQGRPTLARLLTEVPATLPAEVRRSLEESQDEARRRGIRIGAIAWVVWALTAPVVLLMGLRSPWAIVVPMAWCLAGLGMSLRFARLPRLRGWRVALYACTFAGFVAMFSAWLGPFVLVPVAAATILFWGLAFGRPRERLPLIMLSLLCVAGPAALEYLGWVPESYRFVPEGVLMVPRALELRPGYTTFGLLWSSLTFLAAPALFLGRLKDSLFEAEARLALQAWQLRQLTEDPMTATRAGEGAPSAPTRSEAPPHEGR